MRDFSRAAAALQLLLKAGQVLSEPATINRCLGAVVSMHTMVQAACAMVCGLGLLLCADQGRSVSCDKPPAAIVQARVPAIDASCITRPCGPLVPRPHAAAQAGSPCPKAVTILLFSNFHRSWGPQQESAQPHHGQIARDKMSTKVCKQLLAAHECLAHADTAFSGRDAAQLLDLLQVRLVAWSLHTEHTRAFILLAMNKSQLWTLHQCHMRPETPLAAPAYCLLAQ